MRSLAFLFISFFLGGLSEPARAETLVPRTIIALYNGGEVQSSYVHLLAEMPLNHLGLKVEYYDVNQPLPDIDQRADVRGIITWFYNSTKLNPETYYRWALSAMDRGKKLVVFGGLGVDETNQRALSSPQYHKFMAKLGLKPAGLWVEAPFDFAYQVNTPAMFIDSDSYHWQRPAFSAMQAMPEAVSHLSVVKNGPRSGDNYDLIMTSPTGGYASGDYIFRTALHDDAVTEKWLLNPFEFFRTAYATDDLPKPDVTTLAGRRIYFSNIDGDGWINMTQIEDYRGTKMLSSEVILNRVAKAYPDMPLMLALIAAEVDPAWSGSEQSRAVARDFLALPNVEIGSHTYSHPFYWHFFENSKAADELPYLQLYNTPTWRKGNSNPITAGKPHELPQGYRVPRAYARQPFDIDKETSGSVALIRSLAPKDKPIGIMAWSGDCMPWEAMIHATRQQGLLNINGGDTRFDAAYPDFGNVSPIGRKVGNELQIYNAASNENTYTNLWSENYHAFGQVKETWQLTDSPMRLKPIGLYYHIYSGEKEAALRALISNIEAARQQEILPIMPSDYVRIAESFYQVDLINLGPDIWRVDNRGALQTIRLDHQSDNAIDYVRSRGVIGSRMINGSLYAYLDEVVAQPVLALKIADDAVTQSSLSQSSWKIRNVRYDGGAVEFQAKGFGAGTMEWQVPRDGTYRAIINGKDKIQSIAQDGTIRFIIPDQGAQSVNVKLLAEATR
jgi:hypothetical protein